MQPQPIPVTIITGFLGSGKTTLLNTIIKQNSTKKFTIIENEFGSVNIDRELISSDSTTQIYELSNGCACCTLNNELSATLNRLILSGISYNHLIIEASGIADPAALVATFLSTERVRRYFKLDGVISLVDAKRILSQLNEYEECSSQIAISQAIIVNKIDELHVGELDYVLNTLRILNSEAQYYTTNYAHVDTQSLLSFCAYDTQQVSAINFNTVQLSTENIVIENKHAISSFAFQSSGVFSMESFSFWLDSFLYYNKYNILRIKGVVAFQAMEHKIIVQAVQDSVIIEKGDAWNDSDKSIKLVFLGKNLNHDELQTGLQKLVKPE